MRPRLNYANVVATLALFIALGGASYAALKIPKNSVGSKQLKKNAVTTAKVKNGAVTGEKINVSTLPKVPSATRADHAVSAETAIGSGTAVNAINAENLAPPESAHFVGTSGEPTFGPSFIGSQVGFYKDRQCTVHLLGQAAGPSGDDAFNLPEADWPKVTAFEPIAVSGVVAGNVEVVTDGEVRIFVEGGGTKNVGLDGVTFRAAAC